MSARNRRLIAARQEELEVQGEPVETGLLDRFGPALTTLGALRHAVEMEGVPLAAVYIEGARAALRQAYAAAAHRGAWSPGVRAGKFTLLGIGDIAVAPMTQGALWERGRLQRHEGDLRFRTEPGADLDPALARPGLAEDLLADMAMREAASRPAFAALLAAALGYHRWIHVGSGRKSAMDYPEAATVVSMLSGGRVFPRWPVAFAGLILDRQVCDELVRLGWRRLAPHRLSGDSEERSLNELGLRSSAASG